MPTVCVFCASSRRIDDRYLGLATELGTALAERGLTLVSGGGGISMMGAVARAVRSGGGHTVGVIPEGLLEFEVADREADELVVTPDMRTRKAEMDRRADAFIALPGGIGTLEELLEVWTAYTLGMHAKPIVVIDPWHDFEQLHALTAHLVGSGFVHATAASALHWCASVDEALDVLAERWAAPDAPADIGAHITEALEAN